MTTPVPPPPRRRLIGWRDVALFAALTVLPLVLGGRGRLNADTKQYLYLDPGQLLERARSLWDPALGGGTVSHQAIGYLWPMGPYYWLADAAGVPDWIAQRVWIGGIQLAAALGVLAFLRHLAPRHTAQLVAAGLYGLSPFVLGHVTGQSGLLLPFAALGWLALCVALAIERGGWRWPAAFALVVTTCGSLNGSSTFFVLLGGLLWIPYTVLVTRTSTLRSGVVLLAKLGGLTFVTQLWWLVAYAVGGGYGLPILSVTENVRTTSGTTSAMEVLRGLGYWFFYGRDKLGPWLDGIAPPYIGLGLLAFTLTLPLVVLVLGGLARWTARAYFGALVVVGSAISIGAFPEPGSPFGSLFESLSRNSDLVLSLRNTQRAAPLVILGLAGFVAAGGAALQRRHTRVGAAVLVAVAVLVAGALPAQWRAGLIAERFHREEVAPAWTDAAAHLDGGGRGRVLELPGIDFASYRWGHTLDPVLTGLTDRDVLFRELVPAGGAAGASLLAAFDSALQEYTLEASAIAPVARLFGVEDIVIRGDLEYERYRTVRPEVAWALATSREASLEKPSVFGTEYRNDADASRPMIDEIELGLPTDVATPPQVAVLSVPDGGRTILSTRSTGASTILAGDGEGVLAAASAGLVDGTSGGPLLLAGTIDQLLASADAIGAGTRYVVTDTNRKRAGRWYSLRENVGATEPVDRGVVLDDPSDARLDVTAGRGAGERTVAEYRGAERIWANSYGNPFTLLPEDRPVNAFDGDPLTSWRLDMISRDDLPLLGITLPAPVSAAEVTLVPVTNRPGTTAPVRVRVTLDGRRVFEALAVSPPEELSVPLDGKPFTTLVVEVLSWTTGGGPVGVADVRIPGVEVDEVLRLPTDTLGSLGPRTGESPLAIVLTRHRANRAEVVRRDPEPALARTFALAGPASFVVRGTARLNAGAADALLDRVAGLPDATAGGWTARSSEHLAGSLASRASAAFDGDARTAWTTPFVGLTGQHLELDTGRTTTIDAIDADLVLDDRHSTPTQLRVSADGGSPVVVDLPAGDPSPTVRLQTPLTGRTFRFEIAAAQERQVVDWYTERPVALPVAIAEIRVPDVSPRALPAAFDTACRDDLVAVDGRPVAVRLIGMPEEALSGAAFDVEACAKLVSLGAGPHDVTTAQGLETAIDIDRLVLTTPAWDTDASPSNPPPRISVDDDARATRASGVVESGGEPFWLVLDQSANRGFELSADDATVRGPYPVDSYAAGWLVDPDDAGPLQVDVRWAPQRTVDIALLLSGLGVLVCLVLVVTGRRATETQPLAREEPALVEWREREERGGAASFTSAAVLIGGVSIATAVFVHPFAAPVAGLLTAVIARWPLTGRVLPPLCVAIAAAQMVVFQARRDHRLDGEWPQRFGGAHVAAMIGVLLLGASVAWDAWRRRAEDVEH